MSYEDNEDFLKMKSIGSYVVRLIEEGLSKLAMSVHPDSRVSLPRFNEQLTRFFLIALGSTIHQHHRVEATYLSLFEMVGKGLGLLHRGLKMIFSGFPLMRRCGRDAGNRLRETEDRPQRHRAGMEQLTGSWIKLPSLRMLAEHNETLNHKCEHQPRTQGILSAAARQPLAFFSKDCECAAAIAGVGHLAKKRSGADSPE
jgi:hypothetical protein